jgi:hypothetical protein
VDKIEEMSLIANVESRKDTILMETYRKIITELNEKIDYNLPANLEADHI